MADVTIPNLTEKNSLANNDLFIVENSSTGTGSAKLSTLKNSILGTETINSLGGASVTDAIKKLNDIVNADTVSAHNSIARGKSLGTSVTANQWASIKNGNFSNMYIGDYWTINSVVWRIAAFNWYARRTTSNPNHIVIVPDTPIVTGVRMHSSNSNSGGFAGSELFTQYSASTSTGGLKTAKDAVDSAFGAAHILEHSMALVSAVADGKVTALTSAQAVTVVPMTLANLTGCGANIVYGSTTSGAIVGDEDGEQFPLFAAFPRLQVATGGYWLRDAYPGNATGFYAHQTGSSSGGLRQLAASSTSNPANIRPAFCIYQA